MSEKTPDRPPEVVCAELLDQTKSLQLATLGEDGYPHCGYTPFVMWPELPTDSRHFYIFVSELALHTRDLARDPRASIMIIEDESSASQIFARTRVYYQCDADELKRDSSNYNSVLEGYEKRHGNTVKLLRQLPDFRLFRLVPQSGQFVMGFGKAFQLAGENLQQFEHSRRA